MLKIFICYRRSLDEGSAGFLFDQLKNRLRFCKIFLDTHVGEGGEDWLEESARRVRSSDVVLALIGHNWAGVRESNGPRRLQQHDDPVRYELTTALAEKIPIIPIRLNNAALPRLPDLPQELRRVLAFNALDFRSGSYRSDGVKIAAAVRKYARMDGSRRRLVAATVCGALLGGLASATAVYTEHDNLVRFINSNGLAGLVGGGPYVGSETKLETLREERDAARSNLAKTQRTVEGLQGRLADAEDAIAAARKAEARAQDSLKAAQTRVKQLEGTMVDLEERLATTAAARGKTRGEVADLVEYLAAARRDRDAASNEIEKLREQVEQLATELVDARGAEGEARGRLDRIYSNAIRERSVTELRDLLASALARRELDATSEQLALMVNDLKNSENACPSVLQERLAANGLGTELYDSICADIAASVR